MTDEPDGFRALVESARDNVPEDFDWSEVPQDDAQISLAVLHFSSGAYHYAIPGDDVREILGVMPMTKLPGAPDYIQGVVIHRRQVIGILYLERWFGLPPAQNPEDMPVRTMLIEHGSFLIGLPAGEVASIEEWDRADLSSVLPPTLPAKLRTYALATREVDSKIVILLDIKRLIEDAAVRE